MTNIVKHTYEGKVSGLKFEHIPTNGGIISVCIEGVEFELCMLNGMDSKKRSYMLRHIPCRNNFHWDWKVASITDLRNQIAYKVKFVKEIKERKEQFYKDMGIVLTNSEPLK